MSMVEFEPGVEDHGKSITCRAENPNVTGLFVEKSWKIDVVCKYAINIYSIGLFAGIGDSASSRGFMSALATLNAYSMIPKAYFAFRPRVLMHAYGTRASLVKGMERRYTATLLVALCVSSSIEPHREIGRFTSLFYVEHVCLSLARSLAHSLALFSLFLFFTATIKRPRTDFRRITVEIQRDRSLRAYVEPVWRSGRS